MPDRRPACRRGCSCASATARYDTLCHLIYPASTPWRRDQRHRRSSCTTRAGAEIAPARAGDPLLAARACGAITSCSTASDARRAPATAPMSIVRDTDLPAVRLSRARRAATAPSASTTCSASDGRLSRTCGAAPVLRRRRMLYCCCPNRSGFARRARNAEAAPQQGPDHRLRRRPATPRRSMPRAPICSRSWCTGLQPGGQLTITTDVENYPGLRRRHPGPLADGADAGAGRACRHPASSSTPSSRSICQRRPFRCVGDCGDIYLGDTLIIATGAQARWLGLPSEAAVPRLWRLGLRHLRRLLLPRQGGRRRRRRQHRGRGGALPDQPRQPR